MPRSRSRSRHRHGRSASRTRKSSPKRPRGGEASSHKTPQQHKSTATSSSHRLPVSSSHRGRRSATPPDKRREKQRSSSRQRTTKRARSSSTRRSRSRTPQAQSPRRSRSPKSTWKPRRTKDEDLPNKFRCDKRFLDTNDVFGLRLPRHCASTPYTESIYIAGAHIEDIPLASVIYAGLDNYGLRYIANGNKAYFIIPCTLR